MARELQKEEEMINDAVNIALKCRFNNKSAIDNIFDNILQHLLQKFFIAVWKCCEEMFFSQRILSSKCLKISVSLELTSVIVILRHFLQYLSEKATKVLSRSPIDWNMTNPRGIPANA